MSPAEFIRKNIISELEKLGHQGGGVLDFAADQVLDHYRLSSQATRLPGMFDDCLRVRKRVREGKSVPQCVDSG
ncbi:hypothetical protein F9879_20595, partial [Morganella morganii]|uniref:hypothetical protein n=1 Tax=Morganella morganii TaxID=582 RepID=UPI0019D9CF8F